MLSVTIIISENGISNLCSKILGEAVCISLCVNAFWKGMNPFHLPPAVMDK